ncbi:MAG TPA: type I secretion system permease/ATPase [Azospirillaceae bacterium]|nr:type I secretion system permease/ATPase [Azospirillaceae bacterium]
MNPKPKSELLETLSRCTRPLLAAAGFSFAINLLLLVSPLYMMQVYDRVLHSRSESTLVMLTIITVGLILVMSILEMVRSRILVRVGAYLDHLLSSRLFGAVFERQLRMARGHRAQPLNDLTTLRQFLTGQGLFAFFDAPWTPVFLLFLFMVHPLLGTITLVAGILLFGLAIATEMATRGKLGQASAEHIAGTYFAETSLRNAEVLEAMGMLPGVRRRWLDRHGRVLALQAQASDRAGLINSATKFVRVAMQSCMLGAGALLAIEGEISPGMMIAGSIIAGKALAPVEMAVGTWNAVVGARLAFRRLDDLLRAVPPRPERMELPAPEGRITLEGVVAVPPGGSVPTLRGVSFEIQPGEAVGIVGPSAAGKSTLARLIVGVWPAVNGKVRIDGADVQVWPRERLGPYIGYLPQDIELFDGTIAENIARFGEIDAAKVVDAARKAGVHDMILRLPKGYDTPVGEAGNQLSGGQKQRLGLARALYGDPAIFVFDEPNSNLDEEGEGCLIEAIRQLKAARKTIVIIAHRPSVLTNVDKVLVMRDGAVQMFGPRAEVLARVTRPTVAQAVAQPVAAHGGSA